MDLKAGSFALRIAPPITFSLALACSTMACSSTVELVPEGPRPKTAERTIAERVPYPPPPAEVEVLPLRRRDECLWQDGYQDWRGSRWHWVPGAWVIPEEDCYLAPATVDWEQVPGAGNQLLYRPPRWYTANQKECAEPRACESLLRTSDQSADGAE